MGRTGRHLMAGAAVMSIALACSTSAWAQGRGVHPAQLDSHDQLHVAPSQEEAAGLGCIAFGSAAMFVVGAMGVASGAVAGGAAAPGIALPVLGTAFAAGCGVGVIAGPGAVYLVNRYIFHIHPELDGEEVAEHKPVSAHRRPYEAARELFSGGGE